MEPIPLRHIVVTGPESSGKTTLSRRLANHYDCAWVPEYARHYLEVHGPHYEEADLLRIAEGQYLWERIAVAQTRRFVISDTSMMVLHVWAQYRYGRVDPWIVERLHSQDYHLYLLCVPDIPWEAGPLRENPHDRHELLAIFEKELPQLGVPFVKIHGVDPEERLRQAVLAVDRHLGSSLTSA
jgi:NadR type nicotinamide-nucleotide adenylyltransferase